MLIAEWLATPIDHALPVIGLVVVAIAVTLRGNNWPAAILCALPLLAGAAICFPDERQRLLAYGVVLAAAFCGALLAIREWTYWKAAVLVLAALTLLRWIAREKVEISREIFIAAGALLIVAVMRRGPLAVALAALAAYVSPGVPARTALIPIGVAIVATVARLATGGRLKPALHETWVGRFSPKRVTALPRVAPASAGPPWQSLSAAIIALPIVLFAWSGAAARGLPYFFRATEKHERIPVGYALKPGEAAELDVPQDAKSLAVSLANGLQLRRGVVIATINGTRLKVSDAADWGSMRREVWWRSHNPVPKQPAGTLRGYGYDSWVDGAGRVALPLHATHLRIVADPRLPNDARVQIEGFER